VSFSLQILFEAILILRTEQDIIINVHRYINLKHPLYMSDFNQNLFFGGIFSNNPQMSNFMKVRPMVAQVFHSDGKTDG